MTGGVGASAGEGRMGDARGEWLAWADMRGLHVRGGSDASRPHWAEWECTAGGAGPAGVGPREREKRERAGLLFGPRLVLGFWFSPFPSSFLFQTYSN